MIWTRCGAMRRLHRQQANKMNLQENTITRLRVARMNDMGAFLDAQTGRTTDDVLLHRDQQTAPVTVDEWVTVFLYHDTKGRLTASMRLPRIDVGQIAYAPILHTTKFGAFVDLGTERGIFLPFAEQRGSLKAGERVWVRLYEDKSGRLAVTMNVDAAMQEIALPVSGVTRGDEVVLSVYNITEVGAFGITPERWLGLIHREEWPRTLLVGETVKARVTYVRDDGRINASLRLPKEKAMVSDAERILTELRTRGGMMPYSDETDAAVIRRHFGISKGAFKRALGNLMRRGLVTQEGMETRLCVEEVDPQ